MGKKTKIKLDKELTKISMRYTIPEKIGRNCDWVTGKEFSPLADIKEAQERMANDFLHPRETILLKNRRSDFMEKNYRELMVMNFEGLIGKTIAFASFDHHAEKLMMRFSDGTACFFHAQREMEDVVSIEILSYFDDSDFRDVGIMTEEEYEARCEARRKCNAAQKEIADRKLYEELKKKFKD